MNDRDEISSSQGDATPAQPCEDSETRDARRELKQSLISDQRPSPTNSPHTTSSDEVNEHTDSPIRKTLDSEGERESEAANVPERGHCLSPKAQNIQDQSLLHQSNSSQIENESNTLAEDASNENMSRTPRETTPQEGEKGSSPKRKRAHDQLDLNQPSNDGPVSNSTDVPITQNSLNTEAQPKKKRHRDDGVDGSAESAPLEPATTKTAKEEGSEIVSKNFPSGSFGSFASSGFSKLATEPSGFAKFSASKNMGFGSTAADTSASTENPSSPLKTKPSSLTAGTPKLTFGGNTTASPFAGLSTLPGTGFGDYSSGLYKRNFNTPAGNITQKNKDAKPFGAPDSDSEEAEVNETYEADDTNGLAEEAGRGKTPEKELLIDEKRRVKLHKVEVDDGETGEATIVSVRAKVFNLDKIEGWKERGVGMLKINVPDDSVETDENGISTATNQERPGAVAEESPDDAPKSSKVARLIMRQDQTHRVILNTAILPNMQFHRKESLKAVVILFTSFEGQEAVPTSVSIKMTLANAKIFQQGIVDVQKMLKPLKSS